MGTAEGRRLKAVFPAGVWATDVKARYPGSSRARTVADGARRQFERDGVPERELQLCEPEGPEGTRLDGCLKVFSRWGLATPASGPSGWCPSTSAAPSLLWCCSPTACDTSRRARTPTPSTAAPTSGSIPHSDNDPVAQALGRSLWPASSAARIPDN
jgi:hypothetical protein